ncbi:MAG: hypothetical protein WC292_02060 [Clostridia bacterium]
MRLLGVFERLAGLVSPNAPYRTACTTMGAFPFKCTSKTTQKSAAAVPYPTLNGVIGIRYPLPYYSFIAQNER